MNRHPFSGTCSFCNEPPEHHDHIKGHAVEDGNHALTVGGIAGAVISAGDAIPGYIGTEGPHADSQGNYLDTFTIVKKSGKYDVTVRPQQ